MTVGTGALRVNGFDLSSLGLAVGSWPGAHESPDANPDPQALWGRAGGVLTTVETAIASREITLSGTLLGTGVAAVRAAWSQIKARCDQGLVELVFGDEPTLRVHGLLTKATFDAYGQPQVAAGGRVMLRFLCPSPYRESVEPTLIAFGSAPTPLPLGTGPSTPVIQLMGATDPVLTYRDQAGEIRSQMAFDVALGATDYLDINGMTSGITHVVNGVRSNGIALLTAGAFPVLDARDGDLGSAAWPTLETSSGSGVALYRRAWL